MATRGLEECVFLYPLDRWEEIETEIGQLNMFDREARGFVRIINMWADEVTMDGQGRIALPKALIDFAGLQPGGRAQVIGAFDRIEVWDPDAFAAHLNQQTESYETLAERVMGGI